MVSISEWTHRTEMMTDNRLYTFYLMGIKNIRIILALLKLV